MSDREDTLASMDIATLVAEVRRLREGIRSHRDQRGDDRCWLDDEKLYALLPEGTPARTELDPELMLPNCRRFIETRVHPRDRFSWGKVVGGSMLPILEQAEHELPSLLMVADDWRSLFVDDEKPNVERLWMPYGEGRLMLHIIHPCKPGESLFHPHPWSSAMRILSGEYETAYGHGPPDGPPPKMGKAKILRAGDRYEMVNPEAWHYVRPIGGPVSSVMVTSKPYGASSTRKGHGLGPLASDRITQLLLYFRSCYPKKIDW